jgi:hypothetical protein
MRDEVEEFLRRAAQRRAQAEAKRRDQQAPQQQNPQQAPPQRLAPIQRAPLREQQLEPVVEIIEAEEADAGSRLTSSVAQHLRGTTEIARHASSLGYEVDQSDERLEARLHKTFDHQLGSLKNTSTAAPEKVAMQTTEALAASMNLTRLLSNAQTIRNGIILSEVLARPEHRWE